MMKQLFSRVLIGCIALTFCSFDLPEGWFRAGSKPNSYQMGIDKASGKNGSNAATLKSTAKKIKGFGTLMQTCLPDNFLGKRVKMGALVKTRDVSEWAGIWLRIDQKGSDKSLGFDNLKNGKTDRSIKGTNDWTRYEIVLDVPETASMIAYGALLVGTGQIWFDDITFEIVGTDIPTTGVGKDHIMPLQSPSNLNFDH